MCKLEDGSEAIKTRKFGSQQMLIATPKNRKNNMRKSPQTKGKRVT